MKNEHYAFRTSRAFDRFERRRINWCSKNMHGLDIFDDKEYNFCYRQFLLSLDKSADAVYAFTGGDVERQLCESIKAKCVNLELFDFSKYEDLLGFLTCKTCFV